MQEAQIVAEQIDIAVIGPRAFQFIKIALNENIDLNSKGLIEKLQYRNFINSFLNKKTRVKVPQSEIGNHAGRKYMKSILTESFWLHLHFFVYDISLYDPLISQFTKGNISICIIADQQNSNSISDLKFQVHLDNLQKQSVYNVLYFKQSSRVGNKNQTIAESQLIKNIHNFNLSKFSSVLALKISDDSSRIVQDTNRIKLTLNQIIRWIVQRHFYDKFGVLLNSQLCDEIENYKEQKQKRLCQLI